MSEVIAFVLFLIIGFLLSLAVNIALIAVMYGNWVNKQIKK